MAAVDPIVCRSDGMRAVWLWLDPEGGDPPSKREAWRQLSQDDGDQVERAYLLGAPAVRLGMRGKDMDMAWPLAGLLTDHDDPAQRQAALYRWNEAAAAPHPAWLAALGGDPADRFLGNPDEATAEMARRMQSQVAPRLPGRRCCLFDP